MSVVAVPNPGLDHSAFGAPTQILSSLEFFDPQAWGLPAY